MIKLIPKIEEKKGNYRRKGGKQVENGAHINGPL